MTYEVRIWTEEPDSRDPQFAYWNDEKIEESKSWSGIESQETHLRSSGLLEQLTTAMRAARNGRPTLGAAGADLACGTAWAAPRLLEDLGVERIYCVEYSRHRLLKLAPVSLEHHAVPPERVVLCLGSFYDLHLADASLDFVLLAEAFHHADDPRRLLKEVRRVLRPGGVVMIIGEHIVPSLPILYAQHATRWLASRVIPAAVMRRLRGREISKPTTLFAPVAQLLAPNRTTGDHYYRLSDYRAFFDAAGFETARLADGVMRGFILRKDSTP